MSYLAAHGMRKVYSSGDLKNFRSQSDFSSFNMIINNKLLPYRVQKGKKNSDVLGGSVSKLKSSVSVNRVLDGKLNISRKNSDASNDSLAIRKITNYNKVKSINGASVLAIYNSECKRSNYSSTGSNQIVDRSVTVTSKSASDANIKTYADWLQRRPSGVSFLKIVEALRRPVATSSLVHPVFVFIFIIYKRYFLVKFFIKVILPL